jgi:hypothetical protein
MRLADKDPAAALEFLPTWERSAHRLIWRLYLFCCQSKVVPALRACRAILSTPQDELFLTSSCREVFCLIQSRWNDLPEQGRIDIEANLCNGPPPSAFREGSDIEKLIDHSIFEIFSQMIQCGIKIGRRAQQVLEDIRIRRPSWRVRPSQQAGFHIWHGRTSDLPAAEAGRTEANDAHVGDDKDGAKLLPDNNPDDDWRTEWQLEPDASLKSVLDLADAGSYQNSKWSYLLASAYPQLNDHTKTAVAARVASMPETQFDGLIYEISWWLKDNYWPEPNATFWIIWDKIADHVDRLTFNITDKNDMVQLTSIEPIGLLVEVLVRQLTVAPNEPTTRQEIEARLNLLNSMEGDKLLQAQFRLAQYGSRLFDFAPDWTTAYLLPLFSWSSPVAPTVWSARSFSNYIGSVRMFAALKEPFLLLFERQDMPVERQAKFGEWLTVMLIENRTANTGFDLSLSEARSALRKAFDETRTQVAHRLAVEMARSPEDQKRATWTNIVGPVFKGLWPQDIDLRSSRHTYKFVQILCASGDAFPDAVNTILRYIEPEPSDRSTTIFSLKEADDIVISSAPQKVLELTWAIVRGSPRGSVPILRPLLNRLQKTCPEVSNTELFKRLMSLGSPYY